MAITPASLPMPPLVPTVAVLSMTTWAFVLQHQGAAQQEMPPPKSAVFPLITEVPVTVTKPDCPAAVELDGDPAAEPGLARPAAAACVPVHMRVVEDELAAADQDAAP